MLGATPQQHIEILTKDPGEGWHTGIVSGQPHKGIFPSNYVKITRQGQAHTAGGTPTRHDPPRVTRQVTTSSR